MGFENLRLRLMLVKRAGCAWPATARSGARLNEYRVFPLAKSSNLIPLSSANTPFLPSWINMLAYSRAVFLIPKLVVYGTAGTGLPLICRPHSETSKC